MRDVAEIIKVCDSCSKAFAPSWTTISETVFVILASLAGLWASVQLCGSSKTCGKEPSLEVLAAGFGLVIGLAVGWRLRRTSF